MMNREILLKALAEKKAARTRNEQTEAQRLEEVRGMSPRIARLIDERKQALYAGLRAALNGIIPQSIEEDTRLRNEQINGLLSELGYMHDYLSPIFDCADCEDTGYTGEGKKALCACVRLRYQELLSGDCFMGETQTFENYDDRILPASPMPGQTVSQRAYTRALRDICERYADSLPDSSPLNLLLYGGSGLGKTYMLRSIGVRASQRGMQAMSISANALLNRIRAQYFARSGETPDDSYLHVPLLLIDDLGTEPLWEGITVEQLFALIEHRLNNRLHTVISTNLSLTEVKGRYTERLMSRLSDEQMWKKLAFLGEDLRLKRNT